MLHPWLIMCLAIIFEVLGTTCLKLSEGFTKLVPSILIFVFYGISFVMLALALKKLDLGIAYAVWAGAGTALIALIGVFFFSDSLSLLKVISLLLVIIGIIGLKMASSS